MLKYVSAITLVGRVFGATDYTKHGDDWAVDQCAGDYQSPIDLKTDFENTYYEDDKFFKHYEDLDTLHDGFEYKSTWMPNDFTVKVGLKTTVAAPLVSKWRPNYFSSSFLDMKS